MPGFAEKASDFEVESDGRTTLQSPLSWNLTEGSRKLSSFTSEPLVSGTHLCTGKGLLQERRSKQDTRSFLEAPRRKSCWALQIGEHSNGLVSSGYPGARGTTQRVVRGPSGPAHKRPKNGWVSLGTRFRKPLCSEKAQPEISTHRPCLRRIISRSMKDVQASGRVWEVSRAARSCCRS